MKARVTFLRADREKYKKKDGSEGIAHRIAVISPEGHPGQVFVGGDNERAYGLYQDALACGQGEPIELVFGFSVFRGDLRLELTGIQKVGK